MTRSFAVFSGADSNNLDSLWVTDGTAAGTVPLAVAGAGGGGLFYNIYGGAAIAPDFAPFGNMVLFMGVDAAGVVGLWRSDGTAAGTYEITVNGGNPSGVDQSAVQRRLRRARRHGVFRRPRCQQQLPALVHPGHHRRPPRRSPCRTPPPTSIPPASPGLPAAARCCSSATVPATSPPGRCMSSPPPA